LFGNICRLHWQKAFWLQNSKDKFTVDSAGTGSWHIGHHLMNVSLLLQKNKISISNQKDDNSAKLILMPLITSLRDG
jgi:protein-tyrosine phosphatase